MKAKIKASGEIIDADRLPCKPDLFYSNGYVYSEAELEFIPDTPEEVAIEGWVLRDDNNKIGIYREKPTCDEDGWDLTGEKYDLFPDITPDMLPKKYRITIKPME